ncbi:MFS transporter [Nonomuraea sp. SBT364]|uniref:MFS transporter n=1 Tax=Nonomuraea sp. SBT364 TaxID=1580530 RepID=UPI0009EBB5AD|nr:MFS transporter [Nonomuraea sp. SBT364]
MTTTSARPAPLMAPFGPTLVAFVLTAVLVSGQLYIVIPLLPDMAVSWGTSPGALTWLVTAFGAGYGVGFLVFGPLSDRFGRRRLVLAGLPLAALATALVAAAPSPEAALVLRAVQGLAVATFPPAGLAYLAERIEPRRRAVAISAVTGAFLASAVLLQVLAQLLVSAVGWRGLFLISGAALALSGLGLRATMLPGGAPSATMLPGGAPSATMLPGAPSAAPAAGGGSVAGILAAYRPLPGLLRDRVLLVRYAATVVVLTGFVAVYTGLQLHGVTPSPGELLALRAAGLPAMVAVPLLMPWFGRVAPVTRAAATLAGGALVLAAAALTGAAGPGLVLLIALYAVAITACLPSLNESISARAGQARGTALALFSFSLAVGGSVGPQVAALFGGFPPLLYGLAAAMGLSALAVRLAS